MWPEGASSTSFLRALSKGGILDAFRPALVANSDIRSATDAWEPETPRIVSAQTGGAAITRPHFTIIEAPSVLGLFKKRASESATRCFAGRGSWRATGGAVRKAR